MKYNENNKEKFNEEQLNNLLKEKIGYLNDFKKQFGYNQELVNKLALINVALKENGIEIDDLFYNTLRDTEIIMSDNVYEENLEEINKYTTADNKEDLLGVYTYHTPTNLFTENMYVQNSKIFLANKSHGKNLSDVMKLNLLIHEFRHALTSQNERYSYLDENTFLKRSGIKSSIYKKDNKEINVFATMLNEAFNEHASVILTNTILDFKNKNIENKEINKMLKQFKKKFINRKFESGIYEYERNLIKPLLNNEKVFKLIDKASYSGDLYLLINFLAKYSTYCDDFDYLSVKRSEESKTLTYRKLLNKFKKETKIRAKEIK